MSRFAACTPTSTSCARSQITPTSVTDSYQPSSSRFLDIDLLTRGNSHFSFSSGAPCRSVPRSPPVEGRSRCITGMSLHVILIAGATFDFQAILAVILNEVKSAKNLPNQKSGYAIVDFIEGVIRQRSADPNSPWATSHGARINDHLVRHITIQSGDESLKFPS